MLVCGVGKRGSTMHDLYHLSGLARDNGVAYLAVNKFAIDTPWAHGFMAWYAHFGGVGVLAVLLLAAWWRARSADNAPRAVARVLWAAGGTVLAWLIAHYIIKPLVDEKRPYLTLTHVEVLLHRTTGPSFPSGHATVAGAVIVGLFLARDRLMAWLSVLFGLLLAFGRVYVGMHYPFDVICGLLIGGVIVLVTYPFALPLLTTFDLMLSKIPLLKRLVISRSKHGAHSSR